MRRRLRSPETLAIVLSLMLLLLPDLALAEGLPEAEDQATEVTELAEESDQVAEAPAPDDEPLLTAQATHDPISYVDENGETQTITDYTPVNLIDLRDTGNVAMTTGWYVVTGTVSYNNRIAINGDVKIVLCDGASLTCNAGLWVMISNTLTIYGQRTGSGTLVATASNPEHAGIGGNDGGSTDYPDDAGDCGTINIYGGRITASGLYPYGDAFNAFYGGAGIGGGHAGSGGDVTISGAHTNVEAYGGYRAAGIGSGNMHDNFGYIMSVTISGGAHVIAEGGGCGAGIGGGYTRGAGYYFKDGFITISGKDTYVHATGGGSSANIDPGGGAGIGGGDAANGCDDVQILDGATVDVTAPNGAQPIGYGMGYFRSGGLILYPEACVWYEDGSLAPPAIIYANTAGRINMCRKTAPRSVITVHINECTHPFGDFESTETGHTVVCGDCDAASLGEQPHEFGDDNICDVCGYEAAPEPLVQVRGHTLTLDGSIGVNTYLRFSDAVLSDPEHYVIEFWDGEELYESFAVSDGFTRDDLEENVRGYTFWSYAKEMETNYVLKIRNPENEYIDYVNTDATAIDADTGLNYCINDYLDEALEEDHTGKLHDLALSMHEYGVFAKHYFAVRDQGSTEELPPIQFSLVFPDFEFAGVTPVAPESIGDFTFVGTTMNLLETTSFRLYFRSSNPEALTFTAAGKTLPVQQVGDYWFAEVADIAAQDLDEMYDIAISNGSETTTAHQGPFGYMKWAATRGLEDESDSVINLWLAMSAMYSYNKAAEAYFNS